MREKDAQNLEKLLKQVAVLDGAKLELRILPDSPHLKEVQEMLENPETLNVKLSLLKNLGVLKT